MIAMQKRIHVSNGDVSFKLPHELWDSDVEVLVFPVLKQKDKKSRKIKDVIGSWKGKMELSKDFDEPLEGFKEYM
ncbi:MAG: DUF2281 domain-containing protein [Kiritimatiellae bacterium]|jgi:hypothetical protein|nr:DUF2281 domain-containing protein [Kiritimatiellia bacterium]